MAFDFPNSPTTNQQVTGAAGVIYQWDGAKWISLQAGQVTSFNSRTGAVALQLTDVTGVGGAPVASPALTGTPNTTTPSPGDNSLRIASTAFVAVSFAPLASPALTGAPTVPTAAPGTNTTQAASAAFVQAATAPAFNDVGRNLLHNALFNIAQRGVGPWTISGNYTADRWMIGFAGGSLTINLNALTDAGRAAIGDEAARTSFGASCVGTSGANDQAYLQQAIEDVRRLSNKTVTLSFWAAVASGAPKLGVSFYQSFGSGGSPSAAVAVPAQAVTLSTTWTQYTLTFAMPSTAGTTLGTNGDDALLFRFWLSAGANNNAGAGGIGVQSFVLALWGVQLEIGSVATPLEKPDPQQDLAKCQRFFQIVVCSVRAQMTGTGSLSSPATWPAMRATPTVALNTAGWRANIVGPVLTAISPYGGYFDCASTAAGGDAYTLNELYNLSADL